VRSIDHLDEKHPDSGNTRHMNFVRRNAAGGAAEIVVNIVLPLGLYLLAKPKVGDVDALLASMLPPVAWSLAAFARKRTVDVLSLFVLAGIALSLLAFVGGGSVRFLQLRENFVTGLFGCAFLVSAAIGKPLIYQLARAGMRRRSAVAAANFERLKDNPSFKGSMMTMTIVWGAGLLAQTAAACALVFAMPIAAYLVVSPILGYGTMGLLGLWTWWYGESRRRRAIALRDTNAAG
jgi:hypothetical protein